MADIRMKESGPSFPATLIDLGRGEELHRWDNLPLTAMASRAERKRSLAVAQEDGIVRLWELPEGKASKVLEWPPRKYGKTTIKSSPHAMIPKQFFSQRV